jgi:hypothetical protein
MGGVPNQTRKCLRVVYSAGNCCHQILPLGGDPQVVCLLISSGGVLVYGQAPTDAGTDHPQPTEAMSSIKENGINWLALVFTRGSPTTLKGYAVVPESKDIEGREGGTRDAGSRGCTRL